MAPIPDPDALILLQDKVRQSEQQFQATFEQAAVGIAHVSPDGRFLQVNQKLCDIVGYACPDLLVRTFQDITFPADLEADLTYVQQLLAGERQTYAMEKRYLHANGSLIWINLTVSLVRDEAGSPQYFISVIEDIQERKQVEETLARERRTLQRIMDNAPDILTHFDRSLHHLYVNPAITIATGKLPEEIIGKTNEELDMPEAQVAQWNAALRQVLTTGEANHLEFSFPSPTGLRMYQAYLTPERDEQGEIISILSIARDITQLSTDHRRTLLLLDLAHDAVLVRNPENRLIYWNQGAEQLYGWTAQEALGHVTQTLLATRFPSSQEAVATSLAEQGQEGMLTHHHRNGGALLVESRQVLVRTASGQPEAILEINRDITEREHLREEREEARARALAAKVLSQQMDTFLGIVSHELKTPLTTIKATLQLVERQLRRFQKAASSTETDVEPLAGTLTLIERAQRQVNVQNRLVNDLVEAARMQNDQLELQMGPCDLVQLVQRVVEDQRLLTASRQIELYTAIVTLPVLADADRVGQVITNYLTNALKYSEESRPVEIHLSIQKSMAHVAVQDRGPGLTQEQQQHLWERFYRVPGILVQSGSGVGLGLGLSICRSLIVRQGGEVGVESIPGRGSTFWFTLPLFERDPPALPIHVSQLR